jgi:hypothetical protein
MKLKTVGWVLLALVAALTFRNVFPKHITTSGVPRIFTQYDTVRVLDTAWVVKVRRDTLRVNVVERVTTTVAETLYIVPGLDGVTAVAVGAQVGDSTLVRGFSLAREDTGYTWRTWQVQFYTLGPVRSLVLDGSVPRLTFYPPPPKPCRFFCKAGYFVKGAALGAGIVAVLK